MGDIKSLFIGGPHTVPYLVTMFEYCLVSGKDFWDVSVCSNPAQIEPICSKLTENYDRQPANVQAYYYSRIMSIKMTLHSLNTQGEYNAADCNTLLMLNSVNGAFQALLRTSETSSNMAEKNEITFEKLTSKFVTSCDESCLTS
jgi:hypothetical protein